MTILGIESSAVSASAAVLKDGRLVCERYINNGLTHSVTLLPMIKTALDDAGVKPDELSCVSVSCGPGSFTGLRIGIATAKGIASAGADCLGVSTLEAMAYSHREYNGIICACMDARCSQVYNALFEIVDGKVMRLCEDRAVVLSELIAELENIKKPVLLVGDGAVLSFNAIKDAGTFTENISLCETEDRFQHASGVCYAAYEKINNGQKTVSARELIPFYLRLPQAERELKKRKENKNDSTCK